MVAGVGKLGLRGGWLSLKGYGEDELSRVSLWFSVKNGIRMDGSVMGDVSDRLC
jgi:hypothetical protein